MEDRYKRAQCSDVLSDEETEATHKGPQRDDECGICLETGSQVVLPYCGHSMCLSYDSQISIMLWKRNCRQNSLISILDLGWFDLHPALFAGAAWREWALEACGFWWATVMLWIPLPLQKRIWGSSTFTWRNCHSRWRCRTTVICLLITWFNSQRSGLHLLMNAQFEFTAACYIEFGASQLKAWGLAP